jgi:alanyl-tRNA synthetase
LGSRAAGELYRTLENEFRATPFVGYLNLRITAKVLGIVRTDGKNPEGVRVDNAAAGETAGVILDKTPFYAESGGQVADTGRLVFPGGSAEVIDVQKPFGGMFVHTVRVGEGKIETGVLIDAQVDASRRDGIARHHTATHLLHAALRRIVGPATTQAGSLVAPDRFRFDFMSPRPVPPDQLREIEDMVNARILENATVSSREAAIEEARKSGALALFGEKYGDRVRLIEVSDYSRELCGGTHVIATGMIGPFVLLSESAVAAGVRRIEGLAGQAALDFMRNQRGAVDRASALLKSAPGEIEGRVAKLLDERRALEDSVKRLKGQLAQKDLAGKIAGSEEIGGVRVLISEVQADEPQMLREIADAALGSLGEGVVVLGSRSKDKCHLVARVSRGLAERVNAGEVVRVASAAVGGSGGGKAQMAQAGGKDPSKLPEALAGARKAIARQIEGDG